MWEAPRSKTGESVLFPDGVTAEEAAEVLRFDDPHREWLSALRSNPTVRSSLTDFFRKRPGKETFGVELDRPCVDVT
ncbi:hypothetical protein PsorP6_003636 [Peronosclerospora sorghi]|uniref:Uncharacterized protein n=1 Tax=Peronosclerospora sorghi TaxID=230839 RepID=A0ACC0VRE3_9STRA|nr:hypothetical protein PsorP6_003636 [Peronosclerospora sorghi]